MYEQDLNSVFLRNVQTDAALLDQKCYILRPFAHPVECCCVLLGVVAQSLKPPVKPFSPVQRDATLLGDVASVITTVVVAWVFYRTDYCQGQFTFINSVKSELK